MENVLFHIIAILTSVWAILRGYRRGLTGEMTSVLGFSFAIVCSHIFSEAVADSISGWLPKPWMESGGSYLASNLACGLIFFIVYLIFKSITKIIRQAMAGKFTGLLDSLLGASFCLANYLLMLSIFYNVAVALNPSGSLMHHAKADDGNIVGGVMEIAPILLGSEDFSSFAHKCQIKDAKKISYNITQDFKTPSHKKC